jgi:hydroxymethylbilane synthase
VNPSSHLRLGTRGSQLALWQARAVATRIAQSGGPDCEIVVIKTSGDRLQEAPLSEIGGKRLFVKEIEDALLRREIDLAVHSSKDLPALLPDGLVIAATLPREDPLDAVVLPKGASAQGPGLKAQAGTIEELITTLGQKPSIGTGSVRRIAQLTRLFPGARFTAIRGNLDTRLRKLDAGEHDALVLAAAGLRRLGFAERISFTLSAAACVPAPGQGIVAIETRDEPDVRRVAEAINDSGALHALVAERAVVDALGGGCQMPLGALATIESDDSLHLIAAVIAPDGSRALHAQAHGRRTDADALGQRAAADLIAQGASEILGAADKR